MSFLHKHPREWLSADVIAAQPEVDRGLIDQMLHGAEPPTVRELKPGTNLFQQGFFADSLHLVLSGEVSVTVDGQDVGHLGPGAVFGELAILGNRRRKATLTALVPTTIGSVAEDAVDRDDLRALATDRGFVTPAD